ncbi:MAG: phage tail sheath family protein [Fimbriimonas sp.]
MPITPTYPGVYIEEISSGVRPITGVATSITAFVGRALRGPVNEAVTINSFGDFERTFGGLWTESTLGYSVRDFFNNGGGQAIIVRLFSPEFADEAARAAAALVADGLAVTEADKVIALVNTNKALTGAQIVDLVAAEADGIANDPANAAAKAAANALLQTVKDAVASAPSLADLIKAADDKAKELAAGFDKEKAAGLAVWTAVNGTAGGATKAEVVAAITGAVAAQAAGVERAAAQRVADASTDKADRATILAAAKAESDALNLVKEGQKAAASGIWNAATVEAAKVPAPSADGLVAAAKAEADKANGVNRDAATGVANAVATRRVQAPSGDTILALTTAGKPAARAAGANAVAPRARAILDLGGLKLEAVEPGAWGNKLRARITTGVPGGTDKDFILTILDGTSGRLEEFLVSTGANNPVDQVLADQSSLVRVLAKPAKPTANAQPPLPRNAFDAAYSTGVLAANEATDGKELVQADYQGNEGNKTGLYALEKADLFNILVIPPYPTRDLEAAIITDAISYVERKRAFLIIDPPSDWTTKDKAKAGINAQPFGASDHAAIYYPRLRQRDPLRDNRVGTFAPSGAVAGVYARTDTNRGVWKAPAGLDATLNGVPELAVSLTDGENGELNPLGLNVLRVKPGAGRVVWGARTLRGDDRLASEYKYVPVRRLALNIEESLYRGLQWVVFEPNDEPLWAQIRLNATAFMHRLFREGAFAGASPKEAYLVKCDRETTTQADINVGVVNVVIGFAPLKPAEFVFIKLQQIAGQQS